MIKTKPFNKVFGANRKEKIENESKPECKLYPFKIVDGGLWFEDQPPFGDFAGQNTRGNTRKWHFNSYDINRISQVFGSSKSNDMLEVSQVFITEKTAVWVLGFSPFICDSHVRFG
jgi:hypothetical protein